MKEICEGAVPLKFVSKVCMCPSVGRCPQIVVEWPITTGTILECAVSGSTRTSPSPNINRIRGCRALCRHDIGRHRLRPRTTRIPDDRPGHFAERHRQLLVVAILRNYRSRFIEDDIHDLLPRERAITASTSAWTAACVVGIGIMVHAVTALLAGRYPKTGGIREPKRIVLAIGKQIQSTVEPNRIRLRIAAGFGVVVAVEVVRCGKPHRSSFRGSGGVCHKHIVPPRRAHRRRMSQRAVCAERSPRASAILARCRVTERILWRLYSLSA